MSAIASNIWGIIRKRPLVSVMVIAIIARSISVIWSEGFIHSDDYYDTVMIAYDWLTRGFWGENGYLRWRSESSEMIGRFPLYTMWLWLMMKGLQSIGVEALASMMYFIRAAHALIGLIPVWAAFKIVNWTTRSWRWAFVAGLILALQFAMPFLSVRNLIEVVGGNLWLLVFVAIYKWREDPQDRWLIWAGIATGLAWMIRFQMAFAALPIPILLFLITRRFRPALMYSTGVVVMLIVSGLADYFWLGRFAGSTITNLSMNAGLPALYDTIPLLYIAILLLMMVPPFSFVSIWMICRPAFVREHLVLWISSIAFVFLHSVLSNQQERFVFPIVPAFLILMILALWHKKQSSGYIIKNTRLLKMLIGSSLVLNIILLSFFTPAYGRKGLVETITWIHQEKPNARVVFIQPELAHWIPKEYGGPAFSKLYVRQWDDMHHLNKNDSQQASFDYVVMYPPEESDLQKYLDSCEIRLGELTPVHVVQPSLYDALLHKMNPSHNPHFRAHIYKLVDKVTKPPIS